ncbi:hypothetical protein R5H30_05650 [Sulfitobacter sp. D35]|uniref:hypothetical protein n=1 Tax=Sulfitobacter sp. D35 TaxID=3083252 RepID=UPI00296FEAF4|nr:hypothetical protein [Sulfitobacter sp. D35]MDW4497457.1 hypothetical protein [Sulfitobacter sp. D35]
MGLLVSFLTVLWMLACGYYGLRGNLRGFLCALAAGLAPLALVLTLVLGAGPTETVFAQSLASAFLFAIASGLTGHLLSRLAPWRRS